MIVDELISLAGTVAALSVVVGVVTVILRGQRKGADSGRRRAAGIARVMLVIGLVLAGAVILVFAALAETDSRFRF